jgi:hypothetical protein
MPIQQRYFELHDIRPLQGRSWISLRQATSVSFDPPETGIIRLEEFTGFGTAAVWGGSRAKAEKLGWSDLGVVVHRSRVEHWGYVAADVFQDGNASLGINLVIDQHLEQESRFIWHLHPDVIVALGLISEGDSWYRPEEGWIEVARLKRNDNGDPVLFEMKSEFLADYLEARGMALYCSSYRERVAVSVTKPPYTWPNQSFEEVVERDIREACTVDSSYPDPAGHFWTRGCLWRTEWVDPIGLSVRVRGDKDPHKTSFALQNDGTRVQGDQLDGAMAWLYFEPTVVTTLLRHRSSRLVWATQETGMLGATNFGVHFGINDLGLITVFAKDTGKLQAWEQRLWSAHNVAPDGGVSAELFAAQMEVNPADTIAPEMVLLGKIDDLNTTFAAKFGAPLLRDHDSVPNLLRRAHRFQAAETDGLLELSKELVRLFIERVDVDVVVKAIKLPKTDRKPGSLKVLEKLVAGSLDEAVAKKLMAPLFGIYDLRLADAHLGTGLIASGMERASVDDTAPTVMQGRQLLQAFISTLQAITSALK